jgi:NAD(P)-dependent dehydrogenase (short-subunit alcohol dehydrogenase family)
MDTTRHTGRTAVVTGAASGIGRATALRLTQEGATVIGCDITADGLAELASEAEEFGATISTYEVDVSDQASIDGFVSDLPKVDILANVAGIMDHFLPITELDDDTWARVIGVNLTGVMRMTRAILPGMVEAGSGSVVTVASEASLGAGASGVADTASKHGVIGVVRHLAFFSGRWWLGTR